MIFIALLCSFVTVQRCSSGRTVSALLPDSHMPQCSTHSPPPLSLLLSEEAHTNLCKVTPKDSAKHQLGPQTHTHTRAHVHTLKLSFCLSLSQTCMLLQTYTCGIDHFRTNHLSFSLYWSRPPPSLPHHGG